MKNFFLRFGLAVWAMLGPGLGPLQAQLNYVRDPGGSGIRIGPTQHIPPCVRITPEGPAPCETPEDGCGTADISRDEYRALPWYRRTEEYLNQAYDSLNAIYGSANLPLHPARPRYRFSHLKLSRP
ncbi:MAG: hypothetical protein MUC97_19270 [Bernardetiaceae bacterium]|jgi:hypothetical protein|nr:hypothetical protein [Bernardetiaceae bacterium]